MVRHTVTVSLASLLLFVPRPVCGQAAHSDNREAIRGPTGSLEAKSKVADARAVIRLIIDRTNQFRKNEKRAAVKENRELTKAAMDFAKYMAQTGEYGHTADGRQPADRAKAAGYDYCIVLENIAYQYNSAGFTTEELGTQFFTGWKESPGHRKNMLDPDVTETGVAIARSDETGYYYAVQMFGRPKSASIEFRLANTSDAEVKYKIGDEEFTLPPRYTRTHTRCRPPSVTVLAPDDLAAVTKDKPLQPAGGEEYAVTGTNGSYQLRKP
jgi:uncharacterized protein YkwD